MSQVSGSQTLLKLRFHGIGAKNDGNRGFLRKGYSFWSGKGAGGGGGCFPVPKIAMKYMKSYMMDAEGLIDSNGFSKFLTLQL